MKKRISFLTISIFSLLVLIISGCSSNASSEGGKPDKIRLDYAYYSPTSLVLKKLGFLEEEFKEDGIEIEWVLSQGSNKALEFLNSNSIDFGSAAGAATLMSKANGAPVKNIYIANKPEWTALVTSKDSDIQSVKDLAGKKVAATLGTDPYIFLLRSLEQAGLSAKEVEIVNLQHGDGATSLINGSVDAWAGLDPHMARLEIEAGAELFYRNADFNTYGFLNVREQFADNYPDYVKRVIQAYEEARQWVLDNPEDAVQLLAEEASIPEDVARIQMERNDFSEPIPGDVQREAIHAAGSILKESETIRSEVDIEELISDLIDPSFATEAIQGE